MVKALFDTNILIDYLNGKEEANHELSLYTDKAISLISWMEVMVGATPETEAVLRQFLNQFSNLPIDQSTSELAVKLRKTRKIKLPDAIVWAAAISHDRLLVTRNTKDFGAHEPGVRVPYQLTAN